MNECLLSFVNSLPETYRTVLVISEFEDSSNNAIAKVLGVTLDTVKIRLVVATLVIRTVFSKNKSVIFSNE